MIPRRLGFRLPLDNGIVLLSALLLLGIYLRQYINDPQAPGQNPAWPLGWWGWFDQSVTLRSTAALTAGVLEPSQHHYPLGNALLGVPGYLISPDHAFLPLGLLSVLAALLGFTAVARRLGLPRWLAAPLFTASLVCDATLLRQWVIPWNTTPVAALLWLLLAASAAWLDGRRRPVPIGLLAGAIVVCRPTDTLVALVPLAALAWSDLLAWRSRGWSRPPLSDWLWLAGAGALVVLPVIGLHIAIYGPATSPYMQSSVQIGFTLHDLGWKAYVLLLDPYNWFADGRGLVQRAPWIVPGFAGVVLALLREPARRMIGAALIVHGVLYVSYVDLLPTGMWRFMNVHYFAWAIPGYTLLGVLLLRDLLRPGQIRVAALACCALTLLAVCVRMEPQPVGDEDPAKALDFDGPLPAFVSTYFGAFVLQDAVGPMVNQTDIRVFVALHGIRVIGLRRDFVGPVRWVQPPEGFADSAPARRLRISPRIAWPPRWQERPRQMPRIPVPES